MKKSDIKFYKEYYEYCKKSLRFFQEQKEKCNNCSYEIYLTCLILSYSEEIHFLEDLSCKLDISHELVL